MTNTDIKNEWVIWLDADEKYGVGPLVSSFQRSLALFFIIPVSGMFHLNCI